MDGFIFLLFLILSINILFIFILFYVILVVIVMVGSVGCIRAGRWQKVIVLLDNHRLIHVLIVITIFIAAVRLRILHLVVFLIRKILLLESIIKVLFDDPTFEIDLDNALRILLLLLRLLML